MVTFLKSSEGFACVWLARLKVFDFGMEFQVFMTIL